MPLAVVLALSVLLQTVAAQRQAAEGPAPGWVPGWVPAGQGRAWVAGDPHVHAQKRLDTDWDTSHWPQDCGSTHAERGDRGSLDFSEQQLLAQMERQGLAVAWVLMINGGGIDLDTMYCEYAPRVTGAEHPLTADDPRRVLAWAVEVSPFPDTAGRFGHVVGLGVRDAYFCPLDGFPAPLLDHMRDPSVAGNRGVAGYAHVTWPVAPDAQPDWPFDDCYTADEELPSFTPYPYLAPLDVVLGRVDYLEAATASWRPSPAGDNWTALYYGLLDAGFTPGLAGGSDNTYTGPELGDCRTWALLDGPLDGRAWLDALVAGATSLADGPGPLLTLEVEGVALGGRVDLEQPGPVEVLVRLQSATSPGSAWSTSPDDAASHAEARRGALAADTGPGDEHDLGDASVGAPLVPGRLQLVRDGGRVVLERALALPAAGDAPVAVRHELQLEGPTWIAARWVADRGPAAAHTAALRVAVDGRHLVRVDALQRWSSWCRTLWDPELGTGLLERMAPPHCAYRDGLWPTQLSQQLVPYVLAATAELERLLGEAREPVTLDSHSGAWCRPLGDPPAALYDPRDPGCDDGR